MGDVVSLRPQTRRPWPPDTVRVGIDFNRWCLAYFRGDRLCSRLAFDSEAEARAEAARLVARGTHKMGPDLPPPVTYHSHPEGDDCA